MTRRVLLALLCALLPGVSLAAAATKEQTDSPPIKRVLQFLTNVHTGQTMKTDEWLVAKMQTAPMFVDFGGLDGMVKQSTVRADKYGGLDFVTVNNVKEFGATYLVTAEVKFKRDHRIPRTEAATTQEDMIWIIRVSKERGQWKLSF